MIIIAAQCLGSKEQRRKEEWFDIDCDQALMERNTAKMELNRNRTQDNIQIYDEKRKLTKRICRNKEKRHLENQLELIGEAYKRKEIQNFYQDSKKVR
ncbi:hypothetical protein QE152_g36670 [Popillia japonica]|uniref:Uncharacterized protein n=1 Tax=Popillia japonica TaxID=7064 RepID=A0AAW1ID47_POPJA